MTKTHSEGPFSDFNQHSKSLIETREIFDAREFWQAHDHALTDHEKQNDVTLSHNLYRGMPSWFNAFFSSSQKRSFNNLLRKVNIRKGSRVLDLGCGTGRWTRELLRSEVFPYGIDVGYLALQYAHEEIPQAKFCNAMLPGLCFSPESFELAVSVTVLQHISYSQQLESLKSVFQVLKPSGFFIVCETIDMQDPSPHIFGNNYEGWVNLFREAGFKIIAYRGCEYLPIIKTFRFFRSFVKNLKRGKAVEPDVTMVANTLGSDRLLSGLIHLAIWLAYPSEFLLSLILPINFANKVFFLIRRP